MDAPDEHLIQHLAELPAVRLEDRCAPSGGSVDLWCFFHDETLSPGSRAAYESLMSAEERARQWSFHFERDRDAFVASRALVRTTLSHYVGRVAAALEFETKPGGKPRLKESGAGVHFSLSHTRGLAVCAVSSHAEVGVDAEWIGRSSAGLDVARSYFSARELGALTALPEPARPHAFLRYWTLKESYVKARGLGLALPFEQFSITFDACTGPGIVAEPGLEDDPRRFRLAQLRAPEHWLAVCVDTSGQPLTLRASNVVP